MAQALEAAATIHTALDHDFSRFAASCEEDRQAIEALGEALVGTDRQLLATAGLAGLAPGRPATVAARGVRASAVRLAPSVHGEGDHGFVPLLIGMARETGRAAHAGEGLNQWSAVHRRDAARAFRLAVERGVEAGPFHAAGEEGIPFRAIAEAIGRGLGLPVAALAPHEAQAHLGRFAHFAGMDAPASTDRTRARLGWEPTGPTLLEDMARAGYFAA